MAAFISLILVLLVSILVIRTASTALQLTGLSKDVASFQARSAFSGAGFTTKESELITSHPVRRRIVGLLMTLGNVGVPTAIATFLISVVSARSSSISMLRVVLAVSFFSAILFALKMQVVDRWLNHMIQKALKRWTKLEVVDYQSLLEMKRGYRVAEISVKKGTWLGQGKTLREMKLAQSGIIIMGVHRAGEYIGIPHADLEVMPGDHLMCYGSQDALNELSTRSTDEDGERRRSAAERRFTQARMRESMIIEKASLKMRGLKQEDSESVLPNK